MPTPRAEPKLAPVYVPEAPVYVPVPAPMPVSGIPYEMLGRPGDMLTEAECQAFGVPYGTTYSGESFIDHPEHPMPAWQPGYGEPQVRRSNRRRGEEGVRHGTVAALRTMGCCACVLWCLESLTWKPTTSDGRAPPAYVPADVVGPCGTRVPLCSSSGIRFSADRLAVRVSQAVNPHMSPQMSLGPAVPGFECVLRPTQTPVSCDARNKAALTRGNRKLDGTATQIRITR